MKKALILLLLLPFGSYSQPTISSTILPQPTDWVRVDSLPNGAFFRDYKGGLLFMKCGMNSSLLPEPYTVYGVHQPLNPSIYNEQLRLADNGIHRWYLALMSSTPAVTALDLPQDVWVVMFEKTPGLLIKMPAGMEVIPVARASIAVQEHP